MRLDLQKVMSQRSTGLCTHCTCAKAFSGSKTIPNFKFCFIKIAHCVTFIKLFWLLAAASRTWTSTLNQFVKMFSISPEQKGASASSMYVLGLVCTVCLPTVILLQSATPGLAWRVPVGSKIIGEIRGCSKVTGAFNHVLFDFSGVAKFMVEKFMAEKFIVSKFMVEKFMVEMLIIEKLIAKKFIAKKFTFEKFKFISRCVIVQGF